MNFTDTIRAYITSEALLEKGDAVVAGVSGGADSLCLFLLLMRLKTELDLRLAVVHVNHCIRGSLADEDEAFVRGLCDRFGVMYYGVSEDVPALAAKWKTGSEETGRIVRQRAYAGCLRKLFDGKGKVALAHHRDDLAETVLLSMIRGTGIKGMGGISPKARIAVENGTIDVIHPLLCVGRAEIEDWLSRQGETWRNDHTNEEDAYTRNRIRHNIIPALKAENPGAVEHIANLAAIASITSDYIERQADKAISELSDNNNRLKISGLINVHPALFGEIMRRWLADRVKRDTFISSERIEAVKKLILSPHGHYAQLPDGYIVEKCGGYIDVIRAADEAKDHKQPDPGVICCKKPLHGEEKKLIFAGYEFTFSVRTRQNMLPEAPADENFFYILTSYDRIADICLRFPLPGDRMVISGRGEHKKLSRIFIDAGIPVRQRKDVPLVLSGRDIFWAVGVRDCPAFFVRESDEVVLLCQARRFT